MEPRDGTAAAALYRRLGDLIQRRRHAEALGEIDARLSGASVDREERVRLLALAGHSEYRRGAYAEAAALYVRAGTIGLYHPTAWARPMVAQVRALLKSGDVAGAAMMAREVREAARQRWAGYQEALGAARRAARSGQALLPAAPVSPGALAARLGRMFLDEGELELAEDFLGTAVGAGEAPNPSVLHDRARMALARGRAEDALRLAGEALREGGYGARTLAVWPTLIAARRACGGWRIGDAHLRGLDRAGPGVRARAVLMLVREMRNRDMRQWREVADQWMRREAQDHPAVAAELRKLSLAAAKIGSEAASARRMAAEAVLATPGLGPLEWLAAAKEKVRCALWEGRAVDLDGLAQSAERQYGPEFRVRARHGLALACMMAKRHDLARDALRDTMRRGAASGPWWSRSVWALGRMEAMLGRHDDAADAYGRIARAEEVPPRFRLQAGLLWAGELVASGRPERVLAARELMEDRLKVVRDPDVLMDFARQLQHGPEQLRPWSEELFARGAAMALDKFREARHPATAMLTLFRLARRQVFDFRQSARVVAFWESLAPADVDRLWSRQSVFWSYLGLVMEAYSRSAGPDRVEAFAQQWLQDPATPPEGHALIRIPYGRWLLSRRRVADALAEFDAAAMAAPAHPECALAHYWQALVAWKRGDVQAARDAAIRIRAAQGTSVGLLAEWNLDAKALLLLAGLDPAKVDAQAVNYSRDRLVALRGVILDDLAALP